MPKGNTNTRTCRKLEILGLLQKTYALAAPDIAKRIKMHPRSVYRYLRELRAERKVFRRFELFSEGARRPTFYYSIRRDG